MYVVGVVCVVCVCVVCVLCVCCMCVCCVGVGVCYVLELFSRLLNIELLIL